jgi:formamidopyrimidine-DNA glycosylase
VPELPEVETLRSDLAKEVTGKKLKAVAVSNGRSVRRHKSAKAFRDLLEGHVIKGVHRVGKNLLVPVETGNTLVIHLGMSGQLFRSRSSKDAKIKHTHVVFTFTQGGELWFIDPRTFGELYVAIPPSPEEQAQIPLSFAIGPDGAALRRSVPEIADLGFDPIDDMMSWEKFAVLLRQRSVGLKTLLMDQHFVAGIGNIYSDEILYAAGLRYDRTSDSLSTTEVRRLYRAMVEILADAIKHRGSSLSDEQYRDLFGNLGNYSQFHEVYDREGEPCRRCRGPIVREKFAGRSTFYCQHCQI